MMSMRIWSGLTSPRKARTRALKRQRRPMSWKPRRRARGPYYSGSGRLHPLSGSVSHSISRSGFALPRTRDAKHRSISPQHYVPQRKRQGRCRSKRYPNAPVSHLAQVYIVSGIRGLLHGQILEGSSFLPASTGRDSCEAWTVILKEPNGKD
jgi:hypothetical protein